MTATVSAIRSAAPARKLRRAPKPRRTPLLVSATAACIPGTAAMLGWVAAEVAVTGSWLSLLPAAMTIAMLTVSLPHVSRGLQHTLRINRREAWALAIAVDLAMVVVEAVLHFAPGTATGVCWAVMAVGLVGSTAYNVVGFRQH